jgi:hypothetical protein
MNSILCLTFSLIGGLCVERVLFIEENKPEENKNIEVKN